jgi:hypothetical protein
VRVHRGSETGAYVQANGNNAVDREQIRPSLITVGLRRLAVVSTILSFAFVASISIAGASADSRVDGSVSGRAPFDFGTGCSFVHQRFITTVDITHGPRGTLLVDTCVDFGTGGSFVLSGTFVFTALSGTLTGTANGTVPSVGNPVPIDLTLTVTQGMQGFGHTSGTLHLAVQWTSNQVDGGPVTGALTAALTH